MFFLSVSTSKLKSCRNKVVSFWLVCVENRATPGLLLFFSFHLSSSQKSRLRKPEVFQVCCIRIRHFTTKGGNYFSCRVMACKWSDRLGFWRIRTELQSWKLGDVFTGSLFIKKKKKKSKFCLKFNSSSLKSSFYLIRSSSSPWCQMHFHARGQMQP